MKDDRPENATIVATGRRVRVYKLKNPKDDRTFALYQDGGKTTFRENEIKLD